MKDLESFISEIKGTFFEQILDIELQEITDKIRPKDSIIGNANLFEKKCFLFYKKSCLTQNLTYDKLIEYQSQALVSLSIMRLFIIKRFNLEYKDALSIWIRENDSIVLDNEKKID